MQERTGSRWRVELLGILDPREEEGCLVSRVPSENQVHLDSKGPKGHPDPRGLEGSGVSQDREESLVYPDHRVVPGQWEVQA